jgi:hypothetical protein
MFAASKSGSVAEATDAQFNYVTMLLHGDGTNGAQNNTFLDSSTNNFTITRNGNTTQGTFTPYGSNWSNYFDGNGDYLSAASSTPLNCGTGDFTIECWVFISSRTLNYPLIFGNNNGGYSAGAVALVNSNADSGASTDRFCVSIFDSQNPPLLVASSTNSTSTWYHLAVVRNGTSLVMYRNGTSVASATISSSLVVDWGKLGSRIGGGNWDGAQSYFNGYISNLRLVKGTAVYTSSFTPSTTPLTAITNTSLLTCADNRFIDDSTNNFTITKSGDVSVQRFSPFSPTTAYSTSLIGGSAYLDGTGDYLTAPSTSGQLASGDFTVEAYIYPIARTNLFPTIWSNYNSYTTGSLAIFAGHNSGTTTKYQVAINGASFPTIESTATIVYNQWTHIAVVRSSGVITLYVNGVANGTYSISSALNGTNTTFIGTSGDELVNGCFNGYISNSRVVKGTAVYTSAFTPPTAPLTAITNTSLLLNYTNAGILDNAMMNNLETVGNAQISTSVKKYGTGSLAFDGTGDALYSNAQPNAFNTGDFTLEFWIYFNAVNNSTTKFVYDMRNSGATSASFLAQETDNSWTFWNGAGTQISTGFTGSTFSATTWTHVAICRSSGVTKFFVNGTQTNSVADTSNYANSTIVVGSRYNYANGLNAYIDDLRITKGVARYTANFTAPTTAFADKG